MTDLKQKGEEFSKLLGPALTKIIHTLQQHGKEVYIIGGAVRDFLCDHPVKDYDVATNALPEQIINWLSNVNIKTKPIGGKFGTVLAIAGKEAFDISTYRRETFTTYGKPPNITFVESLNDDLIRRDFRINSILYDPQNQTIVDYYGGWDDIQNHSLSMIGNPSIRLREDGLRIIRLARFMSKFDLTPEPEILSAVQSIGESIKFRSIRVIQLELFKFLRVQAIQSGLSLLLHNKIFQGIFPGYPFILSFKSGKQLPTLIETFCSLEFKDEIIRLFGILLIFSNTSKVKESHFESVSKNLSFSKRQNQLLVRLYNSWNTFPASIEIDKIKRWVRATGINSSEMVAKLFFLNLSKTEDMLYDQEEEYLRIIREIVERLKSGKSR